MMEGARVTSFQAFLESRAFGYFGLGWGAPGHIQWPCVVQGGAGVLRQPHQTPGGSQNPPGVVRGWVDPTAPAAPFSRGVWCGFCVA